MDNRGEFLITLLRHWVARCDLNRKQKMRRFNNYVASGLPNLTNSSAVTRLFSLPAMLC